MQRGARRDIGIKEPNGRNRHESAQDVHGLELEHEILRQAHHGHGIIRSIRMVVTKDNGRSIFQRIGQDEQGRQEDDARPKGPVQTKQNDGRNAAFTIDQDAFLPQEAHEQVLRRVRDEAAHAERDKLNEASEKDGMIVVGSVVVAHCARGHGRGSFWQ
jgi:hypothetical protein